MRSALLLALMMVTLCLAGCLDGPTVDSGIGDTTEEELALPDWNVGDQWLYTFVTPQFGEDSARLVVAEKTTSLETTDSVFPLKKKHNGTLSSITTPSLVE